MPKTDLRIVALLAFLAGCATAVASRPWVASPAKAQSSIERWDYLCFEAEHASSVMERAKYYGRSGWEMVTTGNGTGQWNNVWCFKRPL